MTNTERSKGSGINFIDITVVLLIAMLWFFVVQISPTPIIIAMSSVAWFVLVVFILSRFTGFLSWMKLTRPTWTITYLISVPIWYILFSFLPQEKIASAVSSGVATGVIGRIIPEYVFNWFVNGWLFAFTESLLVAFLAAFFIGIALKKSTNINVNRSGQFYAIIFVVGFAALLHTAIAYLMAEAGTFSVTTVLLHQFVSFFVMVILGMFFGAPGIIASHIAKNDLVLAVGGLNLFSIGFCIVMDIISFVVSPKSETKLISKEASFT